MSKINFDYLNIFKEPPLMCAALVRQFFKRKESANGRALVVNTSLIGEFAASLPALREFIAAHPGKEVDLLVSPPLKLLAERIHGVHHVYTAKSVFDRAAEEHPQHSPVSGSYEHVVVMRISPDSYRTLAAVVTKHLKTSLLPMTAYGLHMGWRLLVGKTPKSWREVNFEMLGSAPKDIPFEEIFDFTDEDYAQLQKEVPLAALPNKLIIHTGASWVTNRWSNNNWVELLRTLHPLGYEIIFVGSNRDKADYDFIASQLDFPIHSQIEQMSLVQLVLLLRKSQYFIGVDSGPRNFAHVCDLPSITLLGPGPHMYTPPNPRDITLDRSGGRGLYQRFVGKKNNLFINRITPQDVADAFARLSE